MLKIGAAKAPLLEVEWFGADAPNFVFRPIHYLGSKLRVLTAIERAIDRLDPSGGTVCDLFSGSATVSRYLSRRRRVLAVDIQEYARVLAEAVLNNGLSWTSATLEAALQGDNRSVALQEAVSPLAKLEKEAAAAAMRGDLGPLCELLEVGNLASLNPISLPAASKLRAAAAEAILRIEQLNIAAADTVCVRHFGGQYFSYAQSAELDALATLARSQGSPVLLAAALSTASHLVNSIGKQFAQPIRPRDKAGKPKQHVVKKIIAERAYSAKAVFLKYLTQYTELAAVRRDHVAIRADFREALAKPVIKPSVVYADPPYTRDHYSRFYHTLETIAVGDDPSITMSNLGGGNFRSRGGYRAGRHQSPFCIKSEAPAAFSALFQGVAALRVPLVLSYSGYDPSMEARPRVVPLQNVVTIAKQHFNDVQIEVLQNLEHMKLNTTALNKAAKGTTEVLLLCR